VRKLIGRTAAVLGAVIILGAILFAYFIYTPLPPLPTLAGQARLETISVDGRERRYLSYVPAHLPHGSPLVIVLHASLIDGAFMRRITGGEFDALADKNHFAVLYPDAYKGNWNDCRVAQRVAARMENVDDLGFMRALVTSAVTRFSVDPKKVFAVGLSNGGQMALTLATQSPSPVAAVAVFAASLPTPDNSRCPQDTATARVMLVDGTDDPLHPYRGGEASIFGFQPKGTLMSPPQAAKTLADRNGLALPPDEKTLAHRDPTDPTSVRSFSWSRGGKPYVILYEVRGGGHTLPGHGLRYPRLLGRATGDIDGPAQAIDFFMR
jgi:polyhydroxybutyrate depolymerase